MWPRHLLTPQISDSSLIPILSPDYITSMYLQRIDEDLLRYLRFSLGVKTVLWCADNIASTTRVHGFIFIQTKSTHEGGFSVTLKKPSASSRFLPLTTNANSEYEDGWLTGLWLSISRGSFIFTLTSLCTADSADTPIIKYQYIWRASCKRRSRLHSETTRWVHVW